MAEGLVLPDGSAPGAPVDAEAGQADFSRMMVAQSDAANGTVPAPDIPSPPDRAPREDADRPKARRGRPPKDRRAAKPAAPKPTVSVKDDYTTDVQALVGSVWTVAASIPATQPYALVLSNNADALTSALAAGAKSNEFIRRFVSGGGQVGWQLQLAAVGLNMGMTAYQIMGDKDLREQAREATKAQLKAAMKAQGIEVPGEPSNDNRPTD